MYFLFINKNKNTEGRLTPLLTYAVSLYKISLVLNYCNTYGTKSNISLQNLLVNSRLNSIVYFPGLSESTHLPTFDYVFLDGIHLYTINLKHTYQLHANPFF